jgi:hypothetical protein
MEKVSIKAAQNKKRIGLEGITFVGKWKERAKYLKETVKIYTTLMVILVIIVWSILWFSLARLIDHSKEIKKRVKRKYLH